MEDNMERETTIIRTDSGTVRVVKEWEDYDPALCCNGGSYYQPTFTCTCPRRSEVLTIEDTSCGDFGTRVWFNLRRRELEVAGGNYGTMWREEEESTSFSHRNPSHRFWLSVAERMGYRLPTVEGVEEKRL